MGTPAHSPAAAAHVAPVYHPPAGVVSKPAAGGGQMHVNARTNTTVHTDASGRIARVERPGLTATSFRSDGHAARIEHTMSNGDRMVVQRGFGGVRHVEVVRPGGVRIVSTGRMGFVERPFRPGYVSRTYVVGGVSYVNVYRSYSWRGYAYNYYVPRYYYSPGWYGWCASPWTPVSYSWGWDVSPWYGYYGWYFNPYPVYSSPAFWLTDYLIAASLQAAYERQLEANAMVAPQVEAAPAQAALSPETKQLIADEVARQIAAQQAQAQQPAAAAAAPQAAGGEPPALDPNQRVFVVSSAMNVNVNGSDCSLSPGDIVYRTGDSPGDDGKVGVNILSSKSGECAANSPTAIEVATLQEMHNHFREQLSTGMEELAKKQGNGLPQGPAAGAQPVAEGTATADPEAQKMLAEQSQAADATESQVQQAAAGG
jgi:hypothetical protein